MGADSSPAAAGRPWRTADAQVLVEDLGLPAMDDDSAHHLRRVLRLGDGAVVCATDGHGGWRLCALTAEGGLQALGEVNRIEPPAPGLTVGFAALKGGRNELVVQKLTELGIDRIWVLQCERSVVRWDDTRAARQRERLGRVAAEAMSQCRRLWSARVEVLDLADAIERGRDGRGAGAGELVLADAGGRGLTLAETAVLVGPEGGWAPSERECAGSVGLGEHVLRAETAAIVAGSTMAQLRVGLQRPGLPSLSP